MTLEKTVSNISKRVLNRKKKDFTSQIRTREEIRDPHARTVRRKNNVRKTIYGFLTGSIIAASMFLFPGPQIVKSVVRNYDASSVSDNIIDKAKTIIYEDKGFKSKIFPEYNEKESFSNSIQNLEKLFGNGDYLEDEIKRDRFYTYLIDRVNYPLSDKLSRDQEKHTLTILKYSGYNEEDRGRLNKILHPETGTILKDYLTGVIMDQEKQAYYDANFEERLQEIKQYKQQIDIILNTIPSKEDEELLHDYLVKSDLNFPLTQQQITALAFDAATVGGNFDLLSLIDASPNVQDFRARIYEDQILNDIRLVLLSIKLGQREAAYIKYATDYYVWHEFSQPGINVAHLKERNLTKDINNMKSAKTNLEERIGKLESKSKISERDMQRIDAWKKERGDLEKNIDLYQTKLVFLRKISDTREGYNDVRKKLKDEFLKLVPPYLDIRPPLENLSYKSVRKVGMFGVQSRESRHPGNRFHKGLDLLADVGTPIYAAEDGTIIPTGYQKEGLHWNLKIKSLGGWEFIYGHLQGPEEDPVFARIYDELQRKGYYVIKKGEEIGKVADLTFTEDRYYGTEFDYDHVHFSIKYWNQFINPLFPVFKDRAADIFEHVMHEKSWYKKVTPEDIENGSTLTL